MNRIEVGQGCGQGYKSGEGINDSFLGTPPT